MLTTKLIPAKHLESIFLTAGFYGELAHFEVDFPSSSILLESPTRIRTGPRLHFVVLNAPELRRGREHFPSCDHDILDYVSLRRRHVRVEAIPVDLPSAIRLSFEDRKEFPIYVDFLPARS